ncbi:MAG: multiprotein-bridging factor 1 family protein, partial [Candidatus Kapaibacterium sp.]
MRLELQLRPEVLRWARERAGLSRIDLAKKVANITVTKVEEWETTGVLSFSKAEKLAQVTHTPLGALYLTSPPEEHLPISDFRTSRN